MHLLASTVSGLRVELVVRDHSENFCIQGHHLRSIRFLLSLGCPWCCSDGPVVGIDEFTINLRGAFYRTTGRTRPAIGSGEMESCVVEVPPRFPDSLMPWQLGTYALITQSPLQLSQGTSSLILSRRLER
jgi:hypothetical protein